MIHKQYNIDMANSKNDINPLLDEIKTMMDHSTETSFDRIWKMEEEANFSKNIDKYKQAPWKNLLWQRIK